MKLLLILTFFITFINSSAFAKSFSFEASYKSKKLHDNWVLKEKNQRISLYRNGKIIQSGNEKEMHKIVLRANHLARRILKNKSPAPAKCLQAYSLKTDAYEVKFCQNQTFAREVGAFFQTLRPSK